ncbi:MAG: carboxypeptidase regulatory-like domain-containing protein, partial [Planctomycetes bacterium]|nr:carboxypeptidase regulatory-like domain-containing protein [Planctomycetota bacterium]
RVFVGWRDTSGLRSAYLLRGYRPPVDTRTANDGTFAVHGLEPDGTLPVWVRTPGTCVYYRKVTLASEGDTTLTVRLETGAALEGRATDANGAPVVGGFVSYRSTAWFPARGDFHDLRGPAWSHYGAGTDADGRYRIDCITPGTLRLLAQKNRLEVRGEVEALATATARWDPVLAPIEIRGRVVDQRGEALAGVAVTASPPRGKGNMAMAKTDADGRFVCGTLAPVPYVLAFHAATDSLRARAATKCFGVVPGGDELVVTIADDAVPTSALRGTVLDRDGRPAANAKVTCSAAGLQWEPQADVDPNTGAFRIGPLPPGVYRLQARVRESESELRRSMWSDAFVLARNEERDFGVLQLPETGSIAVSALGPDGAPLQAEVVLEDTTGWRDHPWLVGGLTAGKTRIDNVAPGRYRVRISSRDLPTVYQPVTVVAGEEARADVVVPAGVAVNLMLSPVTEAVPIDLTFLFERDGELYERYTNRWEGNGERTWPIRLVPGSYQVTVTSETGSSQSTGFVVGPGDPADRTIAIRLP